MKYGLIKVAAAIPAVKVADTKFNLAETEKQIAIAEGKGVEVIVFPELSLTGYSCQDLFHPPAGHYRHRRCAGCRRAAAPELCTGHPAGQTAGHRC